MHELVTINTDRINARFNYEIQYFQASQVKIYMHDISQNLNQSQAALQLSGHTQSDFVVLLEAR